MHTSSECPGRETEDALDSLLQCNKGGVVTRENTATARTTRRERKVTVMRLVALGLAAVSAPVGFSGGFLAGPAATPRALQPHPRAATQAETAVGEDRFRRDRAVAAQHAHSNRRGGAGDGGSKETGLTRSGLVRAAGAAVAAAAFSSAVLPASAAAGKGPEPEITSKAFIEVRAERSIFKVGKTHTHTHTRCRRHCAALRHVGGVRTGANCMPPPSR